MRHRASAIWVLSAVASACLLLAATGCGGKEKAQARARFQEVYDGINVGMTEESAYRVLGQKYYAGDSARPVALQYKDKYGNAFHLGLSNGVVVTKAIGALY